MSDLKRIERDVLECLSVIKKHFHNEFNDINEPGYSALINSKNEVLGFGLSRMGALADAEQKYGYEAVSAWFIRDMFNQVRLTRSAFEMLVNDVNAYSGFIKIGVDRISDVFMTTINDAVNDLDRLLKGEDRKWSFTFVVKNIDDSDQTEKAFAFNLHVDEDDMDGGYMKSEDMKKGPWASVENDLSLIALDYKNAIFRQNLANKRRP